MEKNNEHFLPYPRLTVRRKILGAIGRFLMRVLARPQIEGLENIPEEGPVILAGNHVSSLEPVFMFLSQNDRLSRSGGQAICLLTARLT